MANMPSEIEKVKIKMNSVFDVYTILESFNYKFTKDDMTRKWNIFAAPRDINALIETRKG